LHEATSSFAVPADARWQPWFARDLPGDEPVIGHGDLGPWNVLARDGTPVAFIDWDTAGPVDASWELAEVAWLNVQLYDDDVAERIGLGDAASRAQQLRVLVDAYGLAGNRRARLVEQIAEFAIHAARQEAVDAGVHHETAVAIAEDGFPFLWAITWRARSASWVLRNRDLLVRALTAP
jgi:aminoglycoside phosphotransferase (APT) family kinase protein